MKGEIAYLVTLLSWALILAGYCVVAQWLRDRRAAKRDRKP